MTICRDCKKCKKCGKPYSEISNYAERCRDFELKKMTRFEKIKSKSFDEMAEFLGRLSSRCQFCTYDLLSDTCKKTNCVDGVKQWLMQEEEE